MISRTIRARRAILDAESVPLDDVAIVVDEHQRILGVSPWDEARSDITHVTNVDGTVIPGMVDAHSHLRGTALEDHGIPARPFESWICSLGAMAELDQHDEALVAAASLLETGVTAVQGFVDVGNEEQSALESALSAVTGLSATGIRALVVLGLSDRALRTPEPAEGDWALVPSAGEPLTVDAMERLGRRWLDHSTTATVSLGVGPVGGQWSSDELLAAIARVAGRARIHTHLHESRLHRSWLAGMASPLDRLNQFGLLDTRLSGAHGVHLTSAELDRISTSGASLVHCPISNDALEVGAAQVGDWLARGIPSGLGIDSQNVGPADMFEVIRAAQGKGISALEAFAMATSGGARALGVEGGGRIAVGSPADLVELNTVPESVEELVAVSTAASVHRVWVGGSVVVDDGVSVVDTAAPRARLAGQLARDRPDRERRLAAQAHIVDLVERLAGAMT